MSSRRFLDSQYGGYPTFRSGNGYRRDAYDDRSLGRSYRDADRGTGLGRLDRYGHTRGGAARDRERDMDRLGTPSGGRGRGCGEDSLSSSRNNRGYYDPVRDTFADSSRSSTRRQNDYGSSSMRDTLGSSRDTLTRQYKPVDGRSRRHRQEDNAIRDFTKPKTRGGCTAFGGWREHPDDPLFIGTPSRERRGAVDFGRGSSGREDPFRQRDTRDFVDSELLMFRRR